MEPYKILIGDIYEYILIPTLISTELYFSFT